MIVCRVYDKAPITRALCIAAFHLRFQIPRCHPATTLPPYLQKNLFWCRCRDLQSEQNICPTAGDSRLPYVTGESKM